MRSMSIEEAARWVEAFEAGQADMAMLNPTLAPMEGPARRELAKALGDQLQRSSRDPVIRVTIDDAAVDRALAPSSAGILPMILRPRSTIVATLDLAASDQGGRRDMAAAGALLGLANLGKQGAKVAVVVARNPLDGALADMVLERCELAELSAGGPGLSAWRQDRQQGPGGKGPKP